MESIERFTRKDREVIMRLSRLTLFCLVSIVLLAGCSSNFMQTVVGTNDTKTRSDYAGKINDHNVTEDDFVRSYMGHYEGYSLRINRKPSDEEKRQIYDQTWEDIVKHFVLVDLFDKYNITSTMPEVLDTLLTNVPTLMKNSPLFNMDGEFDYTLYEKCLRESDPIDLGWLKMDYLRYKIPLQKLKQLSYRAQDMSTEELENVYEYYYSTVDAKIIYMNPEDTRTVVINAEIDDYYNKNIREYFIPASCDITYMKFPVLPTDEDKENARYVADSLFTELNNGAVFSHLATQYSMHNSRKNDGSLGFIKLADLPTNVVNAVKRTPISSFTKPLLNDGEWSIYQVEDKTKTMVKLRLIRIKPVAGEKAYAMIDEKMKNVTQLAKTIGLAGAAAEYNMTVERVNGLTEENDVIPSLGKSTTLVSELIRKPAGTVIDPIKHHNEKAFILIEVTEAKASSYVPVETVKKEIEAELLVEKKLRLTVDNAKRLIDSFKGDKLFETAMQSGYEIIDLPKLTYESSVHGINSSNLIDDIINLRSAKTATQPVVLEDGVYIGYAKSIQRPDKKNLHVVKRELFQKLSQEESDKFFDSWLTSKINEAKVYKWFDDPAFNPQ